MSTNLATVGEPEGALKSFDAEILKISDDVKLDDIPGPTDSLSLEELLSVAKRLNTVTKGRIKQTIAFGIKTGEFLDAANKKYSAQGRKGEGWQKVVEKDVGITIQ